MATHKSQTRGGLRGVLSTGVRILLIVGFTVVETAALVIWLSFVEGAPPVSEVAVIGLGVLFVGLVIEHFFTDLAVNGLDISFPISSVTIFSASEALLWAIWLGIAEQVGGRQGFLLAGIFLAVLLIPQHTIEDNILQGRSLLSDLLNTGTIGFSVIESAGATLWLVFAIRPELATPLFEMFGRPALDPALVGIAILALTLFIEHIIGVSFSRRS